jgi:hypothetical protein
MILKRGSEPGGCRGLEKKNEKPSGSAWTVETTGRVSVHASSAKVGAVRFLKPFMNPISKMLLLGMGHSPVAHRAGSSALTRRKSLRALGLILLAVFGGLVASPQLAAAAPSLSLSWTDNSNNESGFRIERSSAGTSFTQIATVAANVTTYLDAGLANSTAYSYRVCAYNSAGNSALPRRCLRPRRQRTRPPRSAVCRIARFPPTAARAR